MCGIAGIVRFDDERIDLDRARRMLAHLRHRGPDDEGISHHPRCTLVHARLSILDAAGGVQPMHLQADDVAGVKTASAGGLHVVFNGEIYNHRALRRTLEERGHTFQSDHSDTEVLLHGLRQWGDELPRHLHGMFAFAIWDDRAQRLFLARDVTGKKPLYLRRSGNEITFASLIGALCADRPGTADAEAMLTFLRYGYPFERSMIQDVEEVLPAHWVSIHRDGSTRMQRYWQPPAMSRSGTALGAVEALRQVLSAAVETRLQADAPLACFLSGGIDSSIIAAMAQQYLDARGEAPLRTFSVAMPDADYDESSHAQSVAKHIGSRHTVLAAQPGEVMDDLARLMSQIGEPTADSSLLPTHWLCRAVRHHAKVALSGDGGDELFGGYDRYRAIRLLSRWRRLFAAWPIGGAQDLNPRSGRTRLRRLVEAARAGPHPAQQYHRMIHLFTEAQIRELGIKMPGDESPAAPAWPTSADAVHAAMRWDLAHYLPYELLRKVDRASMAVALEVRCPLLDRQVVELASHLPTSVLMPGGRPKGLLRALAIDYLPLPIVNRPKRGFAVPVGGWFRTTLRDSLADHLFDGSLDALGLNRAPVRQYFDEHTRGQADYTHRLFALLQLSLWTKWMKSGES